VKHFLKHGARAIDRDQDGKTALHKADEFGSLEVIQYLLSSEGGASITETDCKGDTALLLAARNSRCSTTMAKWLLEYGDAQITNTNDKRASVWTGNWQDGLPNRDGLYDRLRSAYTKDDDSEYVSIDCKHVAVGDVVALTATLRVMVLRGAPPESLTIDLAPPFQRMVRGCGHGSRHTWCRDVRSWTLTGCPLLPPLQDLVHGYD
jgi:hypothetical protein